MVHTSGGELQRDFDDLAARTVAEQQRRRLQRVVDSDRSFASNGLASGRDSAMRF